jgi:hypothetical protein
MCTPCSGPTLYATHTTRLQTHTHTDTPPRRVSSLTFDYDTWAPRGLESNVRNLSGGDMIGI